MSQIRNLRLLNVKNTLEPYKEYFLDEFSKVNPNERGIYELKITKSNLGTKLAALFVSLAKDTQIKNTIGIISCYSTYTKSIGYCHDFTFNRNFITYIKNLGNEPALDKSTTQPIQNMNPSLSQQANNVIEIEVVVRNPTDLNKDVSGIQIESSDINSGQTSKPNIFYFDLNQISESETDNELKRKPSNSVDSENEERAELSSDSNEGKKVKRKHNNYFFSPSNDSLYPDASPITNSESSDTEKYSRHPEASPITSEDDEEKSPLSLGK